MEQSACEFGIRRVEEPLRLHRGLQLLENHARLDHADHVGARDLDDPVQLLQREHDPAALRERAAALPRAGAARHHRNPLLARVGEHRLHVGARRAPAPPPAAGTRRSRSRRANRDRSAQAAARAPPAPARAASPEHLDRAAGHGEGSIGAEELHHPRDILRAHPRRKRRLLQHLRLHRARAAPRRRESRARGPPRRAT